MIERAQNTALQGMNAAQENLAQNAARVAQFGTGQNDLVGAIIGMKLDSIRVEASAAVLKTTDKMQQSVLNILA